SPMRDELKAAGWPPLFLFTRARGSAAGRSALGVAARQFPLRTNEVAGVAVRQPLQVVLVLRLRLPEVADGLDLGHHLARPQPGRVDVGDRVFGHGLLLRRGIEDRRAVGRPDVVPLPVLGGRVVHLEKELQQVAEAQSRRIEDHFDRFGVGAGFAVRRVWYVPAAVTDAGAQYPRQLADQVLHAPEAATGQHGALSRHRMSSTWSR